MQHKQSELNAIKAIEARTPVSDQVRQARAEAERKLGIKFKKA